MIQKPLDVLEQFPIRKTNAQKKAFEEAILDYVQRLGHKASIETNNKGVRNIVIGDPDRAKYLITAHYDTPACIGLPNLITPNNPLAFILIQMLLVGILLAVSFGIAGVVYSLSASETIALLSWYVIYFGIVILLRKGPANRHNANDNTSGVVTVLELLGAMPKNRCADVCFVLFDLEEAGLVGSKYYRKLHKEATEQQVVLNLDCVGDGNVIQLTPIKEAKKDKVLLENLMLICGSAGGKEVRLHQKGFYCGNSDHKRFPKGVAVMAFRHQKGVGLYCGRIHTWRDTVLDYENVMILRDRLITFITENAAQ